MCHRGRRRFGSARKVICYGRAIELARRIGGLAGPVAALVTVALGAGSASAATSSSVSVSGPHTVKTGQEVKLRFTGHAATGVRELSVWLDDRTCATTASSEGARPQVRPPTNFAVRGRFRAILTVAKSSSGTHVVCAYLVHRKTHHTAARASWRYVTH